LFFNFSELETTACSQGGSIKPFATAPETMKNCINYKINNKTTKNVTTKCDFWAQNAQNNNFCGQGFVPDSLGKWIYSTSPKHPAGSIKNKSHLWSGGVNPLGLATLQACGSSKFQLLCS